MNNAKKINWEYETKCRRCGSVHEWAGPQRQFVDQSAFNDLMRSHLDQPRQFDCEMCDRMTVQDIVAYDTE